MVLAYSKAYDRKKERVSRKVKALKRKAICVDNLFYTS